MGFLYDLNLQLFLICLSKISYVPTLEVLEIHFSLNAYKCIQNVL